MNTNPTKTVLAELPRYDLCHHLRLELDELNAHLLFELEFEDKLFYAGFGFGLVLAMRICKEALCTDDQAGAYGRLVELQPSAWISELKQRLAYNRRSPDEWDMRHYLISVPDVGGAYEFAATDWRILPRKAGPLPEQWS